MTLLVTLFAAIISTLVWYIKKEKDHKDTYSIVALVYMYWGASLMWLVDLIIEYSQDGSGLFMPEVVENDLQQTLLNQKVFFYGAMNDLALGFACVGLGLLIYLGILIIKDPKKVIWKK